MGQTEVKITKDLNVELNKKLVVQISKCEQHKKDNQVLENKEKQSTVLQQELDVLQEELKKQLTCYEEKNIELETQNNDLTESLIKQVEQYMKHMNKCEEHEQNLREQMNKYSGSQKNLKKVLEQNAELNAKFIKEMDQHTQLKQDKLKLDVDYSQTEKKKRQLDMQHTQLQEQLQQMEVEQINLNEQLTIKTKDLAQTLQQVQQLKDDLSDKTRECDQTKNYHSALSGKLFNQVVVNKQIKIANNNLKEQIKNLEIIITKKEELIENYQKKNLLEMEENNKLSSLNDFLTNKKNELINVLDSYGLDSVEGCGEETKNVNGRVFPNYFPK